MNFLGQWLQKLEHEQERQIHRQTDKCDRTHYHVAFAAGNDFPANDPYSRANVSVYVILSHIIHNSGLDTLTAKSNKTRFS